MQNITWKIVDFSDPAKLSVLVEYTCGEHVLRYGVRVGNATRDDLPAIIDRIAPVQAFKDLIAGPSEHADDLLGMEGVIDMAAREPQSVVIPADDESPPGPDPEDGDEPPIGVGQG